MNYFQISIYIFFKIRLFFISSVRTKKKKKEVSVDDDKNSGTELVYIHKNIYYNKI